MGIRTTPKTALDALAAMKTDNYYFWFGRGRRSHQRAFKKLYELAKVGNRHAHRWCDGFAVELLLVGVPLEQVSILFGHTSTKVTEKHYSPWVKARRDQLVEWFCNALEAHRLGAAEHISF